MDIAALLAEREYNREFYILQAYQPYEYQREFHHAKGYKTDTLAPIRGLMAANQVGKTSCAAREVAMHLTGLYPDWWDGHRFEHPVTWLCGSNTNEQTRDIVQRELFGESTNPDALGTGAVPKHTIKETARKPGVTNAFDSVIVKHVTGGLSKCMFRAYEQGPQKHMGLRIHGGWPDEEPPPEVFSQYLRATISTGGILLCTFTPENGMTELVHQLLHEPREGMALIRATWDDAPHLTEARKELLLKQMSPHEREMRSKGVPTMGSGLVFPVPDDQLMVDPVEIPAWWPRIMGVDFGWDHPFAIACLAHDLDSGNVYVYDTFKQTKMKIADQGMAMKHRGGDWMWIAWPHDGMKHDPQSGRPLRDIFEEDYGLLMLEEPFSNPPQPGQAEHSGGQGVEVGLHAMLQAMEEGRFKVFKTCGEFFEEKATYHRKMNTKTGRVELVKLRDDVLAATRYAFQSLRFADTRRIPGADNVVPIGGLRTWQ